MLRARPWIDWKRYASNAGVKLYSMRGVRMGKEQDLGVTPSGPGSRASHEAAKASSPEASIPNAGWPTVPTRAGLRWCKDCKHIAGPWTVGGFRGADCHHPLSYSGGNFDLVSGHDGRQWMMCSEMRGYRGKCGREAKLFEEAPSVSEMLRGVENIDDQCPVV